MRPFQQIVERKPNTFAAATLVTPHRVRNIRLRRVDVPRTIRCFEYFGSSAFYASLRFDLKGVLGLWETAKSGIAFQQDENAFLELVVTASAESSLGSNFDSFEKVHDI